jgi:hypothetical protein
MQKSKKLMALVGAGLTVLALTAAAVPVAAASSPVTAVAHPGGPRGMGDANTYLAEALGISVDELQAAQQAANEAAIQQAVDEGLITQAQADALLERSGFPGGRDFRGPGGFWGSDTIDREALLAEALGIGVDELQAARDTAQEAALQQAVTDGKITQEQADMVKAQQALRDYLDEQGLQDSVRSLYASALQDAVDAGVITQAQADSILSDAGGFGKFPGMRVPGDMHGSGLPDGARGAGGGLDSGL